MARKTSMQTWVKKRLKGQILELKNGTRPTVLDVGDYEPADPSVGIPSGYVMVTASDGFEYDVCDDGTVCKAETVEELGTTVDLTPDHEPDTLSRYDSIDDSCEWR